MHIKRLRGPKNLQFSQSIKLIEPLVGTSADRQGDSEKEAVALAFMAIMTV
jgi:hypothetical protein